VVVDAKYTAEKPTGFPKCRSLPDAGYCTVLCISDGHLVYAEGNADKASHTVVRSGVRIRCHTLDLSCRPNASLKQIDDLASRLVGNSASAASGW